METSMAQTARISERSKMIIQEMTTLTGKTETETLEAALQLYRRQERLRLMNTSYEKLRSDPVAWQEELAERRELEDADDRIDN